ncbi:MAG: Lon protease family protein [Sandaracinaceae bacterium]
MPPEPLAPDALRLTVDPTQLDLAPAPGDVQDGFPVLGQERAEEALRFGLAMGRPGFNIYVLGPPGAGRDRLVEGIVRARAAAEPVPSDWVYVHCFETEDCPRALELPPGRGARLMEAMSGLIDDLQAVIPVAFESDDYRARRRVIQQEAESQPEEAFTSLSERAEQRGLRLLRTPSGFAFAPIVDGEVLSPDRFNQLPESKQEELKGHLRAMEVELRDVMGRIPGWQRDARRALRALDREYAARAAAATIQEVLDAFADLPHVHHWLEQVKSDISENAAELFRVEDEQARPLMGPFPVRPPTRSSPDKYRVNLFLDRSGLEGAPVVYEDHPILENLIGRVEARQQFGVLLSDFRLIKPGALHRANGGYLLLDATRVLTSPTTWDTLKRALRAGEIRIESALKAVGLGSTTSLDPQPIRLSAKIVLLGDRRLFYLLSAADPDFGQLFKVAADLEDEVPRDATRVRDFARLLGQVVAAEELLPLDRSAIGRMVERAARLADDQGKLSTDVTAIADVVREADHIARGAARGEVTGADIAEAIRAAERRFGRLRERALERFDDGTVLLDTAGSVAGQINGLSVLAVGPSRFGRPSRITCRVRLGGGEVVDIEREVELGGPIHSKGVMILASYLGATYGVETPLSVKATLVFEQSYGGVDGDSASLAELCALLSALSRVPIQQRFAVTGSVNQMGEVQAIGGVNEKIEGFYDVCRERGLDPTPAVLIPASNARHLMLREDVVAAAREGRLQVFAVRTVDEALGLLTGEDVGTPQPDGTYPEGTVHRRVEDRLASLAQAAVRAAAARVPGQAPGPEGGEAT